MALVLSSPMTASILLSPASPLPALQTDLSSSSSSSTSGSCLDLHRTSSAPSTRRIRFAPLPDPRSDLFDTHDPSCGDPQSDTKPLPQPPASNDLPDGPVSLSPSISPDSTLSSARSTPTIRTSPTTYPKNIPRLLRPFAFLRRANLSSPNRSPLAHSTSLPGSRNPSPSSLTRSSASLPSSPAFQSAKLHRISTDDILTLTAKSFPHPRSGSSSISRLTRPSSPPPSDPTKSLHRAASTGSAPAIKLGNGKRDWGEGSGHSCDALDIAGSGPKKRRASSSALMPGAGGGRHASSLKMHPNDPSMRPTTAPTSPLVPKKHVKMLNGRIYGAKRHPVQTPANPFANARDEPEFVEWGYGGMGSVHASAGIAHDMWKGLQRSERGGALLADASIGSPSASTRPTDGAVITGGGRGSGARATLPITRRKTSSNIPECGMDVVAGSGLDEDDGSGMGWVKRRRAEREAKARLEQETKEAEKKVQEGRKSGDSMDASVSASTTTSSTACASVVSTSLTTPTTSPFASRSASAADLKLTPSPLVESRDLRAAPPCIATGEQSDAPVQLAPASKDEHEHHVLTAVRLSPHLSSSPPKHSHSMTQGRTPSLSHTLSQIGTGTDDGAAEQVPPLSPVDTEETTTSTNSTGEDEDVASRGSNEEEEQDDGDDDEEEAQAIKRKTALGAGVEKVSRHVDVEAR